MENTTKKREEKDQTPPSAWGVDAEVYEASLIGHLRADDKVSVVIILDEMSRDAVRLLSSDDENAQKELVRLLDNLTLTAAAAVRFRERSLFEACVETAFNTYMSGFDERGGMRNTRASVQRMRSPLLWVEIAKRIIAVGGFAVRRADWRAVRLSAMQMVRDRHSVSYGTSQYWLRHAVKEADNAGIVETSDARRGQEGPLVTGALELVEGKPQLRPDLPPDDHRLLQSLLGFDLLAALVVSADAGEFNTSYVYPSFIYWDIHEVEPLLARLMLDGEMRAGLFPNGLGDEFLARLLREIAKVADRRSNVWSYWSGRAITNFLNKYPDPSSTG